MSFIARLTEKLRDDLSVRGLIRIVLLLLVVLLLQLTAGFWSGLLRKVWYCIRPFVIGFVIAYIMHDAIGFGEKHGISRKIMIPALYLLLLGLLIWLASSLIPMRINRLSDFMNSLIGAVRWIRSFVYEHYTGDASWVTQMFDASIETLTDVKGLIPGVSSALPELVSTALGTLIITLLSMIISIFMCFEWEKIRYYTVLITRRISRQFYECVFEIDEEISDYLRSMAALMVIRSVEYSLLYLLVGHPDWLILGIASSVSLIIPYVGPTSVNVIGILTALQLPYSSILILIGMIMLLSQLDEYVITPMVHSRNLKLSPLWTLFSIFCASTLLGFAGFVTAVPGYLVVRVILRRYFKDEEELVQNPAVEES